MSLRYRFLNLPSALSQLLDLSAIYHLDSNCAAIVQEQNSVWQDLREDAFLYHVQLIVELPNNHVFQRAFVLLELCHRPYSYFLLAELQDPMKLV